MSATYIASAKATGLVAGDTGISITHGLTLVDGDVLYAFVGRGPANSGEAGSAAACTGWTQLIFTTDPGGNDRSGAVLRKLIVTASGEPSSYTFTITGDTSTQNTGVVIVQARGQDATSEDAATVSASVADDFTPDSVDITTATDSALLLIAHLASFGTTEDSSGITPGAPSGFTLDQSALATNGTGAPRDTMLAVAHRTAGAAGAQTIGSWTHSPDDTTREGITFALAVRPDVVSAPMGELGDYLAAIASNRLLWVLGEASGTSVGDNSGLAHTGTASSAPTWGQASLVPGDATTCAQFTGAQTIAVDDDPDLDLGTGDWWFHVILKDPALAVQFITTKGIQDGIDCRFDGYNFSVFGGDGTVTSGPNSSEGWRSGAAFQLIANVKRSAAAGQFYRNGVPSGAEGALTATTSHNNSGKLEFASRVDTGQSALYLSAYAQYFAIGIGAALTAQQIADLAEIFATGTLGGGGGSPPPTTSITPRKARPMRWRLSG